MGATRPESIRTWVLQGQINLRPGATRPLDARPCATRLGNSAPVGHRTRIFFTPVAHMARYQIVAGAARELAAAAPAQAAGREEFWLPPRPPGRSVERGSGSRRAVPTTRATSGPRQITVPTPTNRQEQCRTHKTSAAMHPNRQEQCQSVKRSAAARMPPDLSNVRVGRHQVTSWPARREARERREARGRFYPGLRAQGRRGCHPRAFGTRPLSHDCAGGHPQAPAPAASHRTGEVNQDPLREK